MFIRTQGAGKRADSVSKNNEVSATQQLQQPLPPDLRGESTGPQQTLLNHKVAFPSAPFEANKCQVETGFCERKPMLEADCKQWSGSRIRN